MAKTTESQLGWMKVMYFVGALILAVITIVALAAGIYMMTGGQLVYGFACIAASLITGYATYLVYDNYQKKSDIIRNGD